jgi:hypothetical protein
VSVLSVAIPRVALAFPRATTKIAVAVLLVPAVAPGHLAHALRGACEDNDPS